MRNDYKKMKNYKVFDCITFFDENFLTNLRFEILNNVVDYFIICESNYDHSGNKKKINFKLNNDKFKNKVRHIIIEENFPNLINLWETEKYQREKIFDGIKDADENDYILYSDSDEIPNPALLKDVNLKKNFGIFLQNFYVYKLNIFNNYETPWEGSRICKKKNLKSFNYLRKKIVKKNIKKPFWKINVEKNIQLFENGGWHFNNLYSTEIISKKLKTFPHHKYSSDRFSNIENIKLKIQKMEDLFERGHKYKKVEIDNSYPAFLFKNLDKFKDYIV